MTKKRMEYAIYRGDEFLFIGNTKECVKFLDCSLNTFRFYCSVSYKKRVAERKNPKNYIFVVSLDDEEDEEEE